MKIAQEPRLELGMSEEVTPLEFLEAVYRDEELPLSVRMRAAIEAAPYRHHKLTAMAVGHFEGNDFASALERAIIRSQQPVPLLNGPVEELPASELKKPMARYRRF